MANRYAIPVTIGNINGNLIPSGDDTYDIGSGTAAWQDLFLEGNITFSDAASVITTTDALTLDSAAAINLEPAGGSVILLDGTLTIDAGVVIPVATAHGAVGTAVSIGAGATTAGTTADIAGGALTIHGGQGKGTGAGGDIVFKTANAAGSTATSLNALATALTLSDDLSSTFGGVVAVGDNAGAAIWEPHQMPSLFIPQKL